MSEQRSEQSTEAVPAPANVVAVLGRGLVDADAPIVRADDAGLTRGDGCFEGLHVRDGVVTKLDAHLARMARSAAALGLEFDTAAWRELVATAVTAWPESGEGALKLVLTRGAADGRPTGFAFLTVVAPAAIRQRGEGVRVISLQRGVTSAAFTDAPWLLGGVKTLSYAINMAAGREAERRGADDVLFVSADGYALETPTGSLVWAAGGTLHTTPTGATGILAGTTQRLLFDNADATGWRTANTLAHLDELHAADALWIVSSVRGPVEVIELDGVARSRSPHLDGEIKRFCDF
ncbi:aminotransferase class IV [uncultured Jatrophihabitans sp.]|uniref:aminotransferase class IV n=1 Tax=uncultured Jatrophihabitans sp. TaxID=1610747 RepID=UPI0035C9A4C2